VNGSVPEVAIVHDFLTQRGGAERVALAIAESFPGAPVYTSLYDADLTYPRFRRVDVRPGPLNRFAVFRKHYRAAFPVLAPAFSNTRVSADAVICSSAGWAHGVKTDAPKIVYCHAVARWLSQPERYLGDAGSSQRLLRRGALSMLDRPLRSWDHRAAASAARYLVNSATTRDFVHRNYGIDAEILHPPLTVVDAPEPVDGLDADYFLCVSRLLPYKNVDRIVAAFAELGTERLVVVGEGPELSSLRDRATPNVEFRARMSDGELRWLYEHSAGLVAAAYEDFGLTPLEVAAQGRPVAVLRAGGFLETVVDRVTGVFFATPTPDLIAGAVRELRSRDWDAGVIRAHAQTFSADRFARRLHEVVAEVTASA
jgi:glycosyltransferase involved in cell wall biosynthesis